MIAVGLVALTLAGLGLMASVIGALHDLRMWLFNRAAWRMMVEYALVEDALRDGLVELDRRVHYRHNVHCPKCGRFARRILDGDSASNCRYHGAWSRSGLGPVQLVPVGLELAVLEPAPYTEPLPVVTAASA